MQLSSAKGVHSDAEARSALFAANATEVQVTSIQIVVQKDQVSDQQRYSTFSQY